MRLAWLLAPLLVGCAQDLGSHDGGPPDHAPVAAGDQEAEIDLIEACANGIRDGDETDADCGGTKCAGCGSGRACDRDDDCQGKLCIAFTCRDAPTCDDGRADGKESDIDCGGPECTPCVIGKACGRDLDCQTSVCFSRVCSPRLLLSFAMSAVTPATPRDCWGITAGDLDGDQRLDIAVGSYGDGRISGLYGRGDGTFVEGGVTDPGTQVTTLAAADFNADGRHDVVAGNRELWVHLSSAQRTLGVRKPLAQGAGRYIATGDWDGDMRADVLTASEVGKTYSLFLGDGKGGFAMPNSGHVALDGDPRGMAAGDLDLDGRPDFVTTSDFSVSASTGLPRNNSWTGLFRGGPAVRVGGTAVYGACGIGDFDHDGVMDIVAYASWPSLFVYRGDGKGGFLPVVETMNTPEGHEILKVADLDRDGYDDVVLNSRNGQTINVWRGGAGGVFQPGPTLQAPGFVRSITVGDWNNDRRIDIAAAVGNLTEVAVFLNTSK